MHKKIHQNNKKNGNAMYNFVGENNWEELIARNKQWYL